MKRLNYVLFLIIAIIFFPAMSYCQNFKAAAVTIDITPDTPQDLMGYGPRISTGIHDRIYYRIIELDDGINQFYLVSSDVCLINPSLRDSVAGLLNKKFGIEPSHFWWGAVHDHSAPIVSTPVELVKSYLGKRFSKDNKRVDPTYVKMFVNKLVKGIEEVRSKLQPARLGVGWGYSLANINRRAYDANGQVHLGLNPEGPADHRIGILKITSRSDNKLLALITTFSMHGTVMGYQNKRITGDAPGIVSQYVQEKTGAPLIYMNGAAGNQAPIHRINDSSGLWKLNYFKVLLGDQIIRAEKRIKADVEKVTMKFGEITVRTPKKPGLKWPETLDRYITRDALRNDVIKLPIHFLKINNDIAIWSAPVEMFCEIEMEIRNNSPFPYTFYFGYTNGWFGYMPTKKGFEHGGYEPSVSPFTPSAGETVIKDVSAYLQGALRGK